MPGKPLISFATALLVLSTQIASAGVIYFDTCRSFCSNIDSTRGDTVDSLASLEYTDNGAGGVDFLLTNTLIDAYSANDRETYLLRLFLNFDGIEVSSSNESASIRTVDFAVLDGIGLRRLRFDVGLVFHNSGGDEGQRIGQGESASWTFSGISETDMQLPALLHVRELPLAARPSGNGRDVFVTGTFGAQSVPEPGSLAIFALGLIGLGLARSRKGGLRVSPHAG